MDGLPRKGLLCLADLLVRNQSVVHWLSFGDSMIMFKLRNFPPKQNVVILKKIIVLDVTYFFLLVKLLND